MRTCYQTRKEALGTRTGARNEDLSPALGKKKKTCNWTTGEALDSGREVRNEDLSPDKRRGTEHQGRG